MCSTFRRTFSVIPEVSITTGSVVEDPVDEGKPSGVYWAVRRGIDDVSGADVHPASNGTSTAITSPRRAFDPALLALLMSRV